jgi:mannose-1-phosphate guanylyltransferase
MPSESVDYGILEKESNIFVVPCDFGWDDVGSWLSVERLKPVNEEGNVQNGNTVTYNVENCIIEGSDKLLAVVGVKDLVIVDTEDATLICGKESTGDIKKITEKLRNNNLDKYL